MVPARLRGRALLLVALSVGITARARAQEPEPFRGDEIDGRDFEYSDDAFLHRFSYDFRSVLRLAWREDPSGFRGTVGSVSSDEFTMFQELRKRIPIEGPLYFEIRHWRDEDFDSRYDRTLTGLGVELFESGWDLTLFGEIVGEKETIDLHLESAWQTEAHRVRLALLRVDLASDKADDFEYDRDPWTLFGEADLELGPRFDLHAWVNSNTPLRREQTFEGFDFTYWQHSAGLEGRWALSEAWSVLGSVEGLATQRSRRISTADPSLEQRFQRRHFTTRVELRVDLNAEISLRGGARYFRLAERDRRPLVPTLARDIKRREWIFDAGVDWQVKPWLLFWPTLFVDRPDNRDDFPVDPARAADKDTGIVAKLNLPLEFRWEEMSITINPTIQLDQLEFGGGNVQLQIPF